MKPRELRRLQVLELATSQAEVEYFSWAETFYKRAFAMRAKSERAIDTAWGLTLVLGAGVTLSGSLGAPGEIAAVLGFLVVLAQGYQRFWARRADMTGELDELLRKMHQEARRLRANQAPYNGKGSERFANFVDRVEDLMSKYNIESNRLIRRLISSTSE